MKKIIPAVLLLSISLVIGLFSSCDKSCGDCGPIKTCQQGQCLCPQGYEGDNCEILSATKFIGYYQVSVSYSPSFNGMSTNYYYDQIIAGSRNDQVVFTAFENSFPVNAVINGSEMVIPDQTYGSYSISGQGTFYGSNNSGYGYSNLLKLQVQISTPTGGTVATYNYQKQP